MEKIFEVIHKGKVLTCKITVTKGSRTSERSQHPDFEDQTPRRIEYFQVEGCIELETVIKREFIREDELIEKMPLIEEEIKECAKFKVNQMTQKTYIEKLEEMGFRKFPSMKEK